MPTDIEIAQSIQMTEISQIAARSGIMPEQLDYYGRYKAKLRSEAFEGKPRKGKLILVTAMSPTPSGEGKTTISVGLADGLRYIGKKSMLALREPSLGPVFGMKGGAAGGGSAQVVPMEDINLHFTGDLHAVAAANNLLAALIDNHIFRGNSLNIDVRRIQWKRCMDMNDRQLRYITDGLGGFSNGVPREDGFDITAASEVMAILCLSENLSDLKERLSKIVIGYTFDGKAVTAGQLNAQGAMAALLKDAVNPNLVQTLEGTPALIHGGPFANIAHGCNSVRATKAALAFSDYVVTEAGFGADLGAEKFIDIKCRSARLEPDAVVIVCTVKALKYHGGAGASRLFEADPEALERGMANLQKHIENITGVFGLPAVVAVNRFNTDTPQELEIIKRGCMHAGVQAVICDSWARGGAGAAQLAEAAAELCYREKAFKLAYDTNNSLYEKLRLVACNIYGARDIKLAPMAEKAAKLIESNGYGKMPVCIAKTQYSFSDNAQKVGRPRDFLLNVRDLRVSAGAGFVVALTGEIMTMPGLPARPAAADIDIDSEGRITGLF